MTEIDQSHDPRLESWVASANDPATDFPLQNLPFGSFRTAADPGWRPGVAIGDQVLDLRASGLASGRNLASIMADPPPERRALRQEISRALRRGSSDEVRHAQALVPAAQAEVGLPCTIGDYTDFFVGIHHARAVGTLFRPDNPLLPNYRWVPIGYHGRSSSIFPSGHAFARPQGQVKGPGDAEPTLGPTRRLDFELELGAFIGTPNASGRPIPIAEAEDHIFGLVLLNDWSARDIQAWEYMPLGPFLAKNFATTISPWIVTMEALAPFRSPFTRSAGDPAPLPYLQSVANTACGLIDIELEVLLQSSAMRAKGMHAARITGSGFARAAYWTLAQMVTHHTVNGCNLRTGDLLGTGTLSGPSPDEAGSMLELSAGGARKFPLPGGEERTFLENGDAVVLRARCTREGFRAIGFGECQARVAS